MRRGLLCKAVRETWRGTLLFGLGVAALEAALAAILPAVQGQAQGLAFARTVVRGLLGTHAEHIGTLVTASFAWVHPIVLALVWAQAIAFGTRVPAEVERGTIDFVLGLPASRGDLWRSEVVVGLGSAAAVVALALAGNVLGGALAGSAEAPGVWRLLPVAVNLLCLGVAVLGLGSLIAAGSERRGPAVGAAFALLLGMFTLHVLGQLWRPAAPLLPLGLMHYYAPLWVLQSDAWPLGDMAVLLGIGALGLGAGGVLFARRDLRAA